MPGVTDLSFECSLGNLVDGVAAAEVECPRVLEEEEGPGQQDLEALDHPVLAE